ncbi:MAG: tRNA pseudouridine(38-40) synthase TruA [Dehalococcoidia bacterium]
MTPRPDRERRIALVLEYDGSQYLGSQIQKRGPTIQDELEVALERLTGKRIRVAFAGRTDAGVHAWAQVVAFTTASRLKTDVFARGLNAWLPDDIAVRHALDAPDDFDPRRHAASRTYRYSIYNATARSPLWRTRAWHVAEPLDIERMRRAAGYLVGEHDFAAFSRREDVTTVRCVQRCDLDRRGPVITLDIQATAFLRQQMRRTAGALAQVGRGRLSLSAFKAVLRHAEPNSAGPLAPAHGLCLVNVAYYGLDLNEPTRYDKQSI